MFGYRLIHKEVLDALLARGAPSAPVATVTTSTGAPVTVGPLMAHAPDPLPTEVVEAISVWGQRDTGRLYGIAQQLLDAGMDPRDVALRMAEGEPVYD